jgi:hypothetical protein
MNINAGNPSLNNLIFRDVKEKKRPTFASVFEKLNNRTSTMNRKTPLNNVLTNEQLFRYYVKDVVPQLNKSNDSFGDDNTNGLNNDLIRKLLNKDVAMNKDNVSTLKGRVNYQPNQMGDGSVNPVLQKNIPPSLPSPPPSIVGKNPFSFYNSSSSTGSSTPLYSEDFEPEWDTVSSIAENVDLEDDENNMDANAVLELSLAPDPTNAFNILSELPAINDVTLGEVYGVGAGDWVFKQYQENSQLRGLTPEQVLNMFFGLEDGDFEEEENDAEYKEIKRKARSNLFNNPIYFRELIQKKKKDILAQLESDDKKMREKNDRLAKNPAMGEVLKDLEEEPLQPLSKRAGRRTKMK